MDAMTWAILLLLLGMVLVVLELFVPSAGVLGGMAGLAIVFAVGVAFTSSVFEGLLVLLLAMVGTPIMLFVGFKIYPYTPLGRAVLNQHASKLDMTPIDKRKELVGRVGVTRSKMLPSGAITVDGEVYNAVSLGMPIEADRPVRVVKVTGNSVVVAPHDGKINPNEASPETVLEQPLESLGLDPLDDPLA